MQLWSAGRRFKIRQANQLVLLPPAMHLVPDFVEVTGTEIRALFVSLEAINDVNLQRLRDSNNPALARLDVRHRAV